MPKNNKVKILIIEDDPFLSDMYLVKLIQSGFDVDVASDGKTGLDKVKTLIPALVLLDIVLPRMDGFEVLESIKKSPKLKDILVVLLTNLGQRGDIERGIALGANDYIIKAHYTPTAVVVKVKEILKLSKK